MVGRITYGLDFGTTNSAISVFRDGRCTVLPVGHNGARTLRSVLFFPGEKGIVGVGDKAIDGYLANNLRGRFFQSIKSVLPEKTFSGTRVPNFGLLSIEDLVSFVIAYLRSQANNLLGEDVDSVILGRPARFSEDQESERIAEKRLLKAAEKAGFKNVRFQLEPIAAAYHYEGFLKNEELVLVADFGGGTSDFTVMRLSPAKMNNPERSEDILGYAGIHVGGDSLDSEIMKAKLLKYFGAGSNYKSWDKWLPMPVHIMNDLCKWQHIAFLKNRRMKNTLENILWGSDDKEAISRLISLIDNNLGFYLFESIERAKIEMSDIPESRIVFSMSGIDISEKITVQEFHRIISGEIESINDAVNETLLSAGVKTSDIDTVFLTGGTSLVPRIAGIFMDRFGAEKLKSIDSFTSVVSGLGMYARFF